MGGKIALKVGRLQLHWNFYFVPLRGAINQRRYFVKWKVNGIVESYQWSDLSVE